jgi:cytochrome c-type biogenesis protein CcmH
VSELTGRIFFTTILLILLIPNLGFAAVNYNSEKFQSLISQLDMQGHADHDLSTCSVKKVYFEEVIESLNEGKTEQEIIQTYIDEYGQSALRMPATDKSGLLAWTMPAVGLLIGAVIVFKWINKLKASGTSASQEFGSTRNWQSELDKEIFEKTLDEERRKLY